MWDDDDDIFVLEGFEKPAPQTEAPTTHDSRYIPSTSALSMIKSSTDPLLSTPASTISTHTGSAPAYGDSGGLPSLFLRKTTETSLPLATELSTKIIPSSTPKPTKPPKKTVYGDIFDFEDLLDEPEGTKFDSDASDEEHSNEPSETAEQTGANILAPAEPAASPSSFARPNSQPRSIYSPGHFGTSPPKSETATDETGAKVSRSFYFRDVFGIAQPIQSSSAVKQADELPTTPVITRPFSPS